VTNELYEYYERELEYLRRAGADFAQRYPKVASRLGIEPTKCDDPHVERLLEGFAFLAARVHLRLDDDYPELCEALLNVVHPQYLRPIPSLTITEFELDPEQGKQTAGRRIPAGTTLLSRPVSGVPCRFRSCYDTALWPVNVAAAQWTTPDRLKPAIRATDAAHALRLELKCFPEVSFDTLGLESLRFFLAGSSPIVATLYEVLANNTVRILLRDARPTSKKAPVEIPASSLTPVGFAEHEGLLPHDGRSFLGYRLLTEYFSFPEKFHFFDLGGLGELTRARFGSAVEVVVLLSPFDLPERRQALETGVTAGLFRLNCTPAVNLFEQTSEPILLTQRRYEHVVVPDARRRLETEVFAIDSVRLQTARASDSIRAEPFYSLRHASARGDRGLYWIARRRATPWRSDRSTEILLSFVDAAGQATQPDSDTVTCGLTCFNSDLPSLLPFGDTGGDFTIEGGGPFRRIGALVKPTTVIEPALGRRRISRLVSQLSLNYLSLVDGGPDALREVLHLHCPALTETNARQIAGIVRLESRPTHARIVKHFGMGIARGRRVDIEFDEENFAGSSLYLFASVIERFLAMCASLNSFSQLAARSTRRRSAVREWTPRSGWKTLL
jgi:type VI secretion system protein ImpG